MKWYRERLAAMKDAEPIISVCGDDCAVCPRYLAKTDEELHETAIFWHQVGWRDHVVTNEEIRCTGCGCRPSCSYARLPCIEAHGVKQCRDCPQFECAKIAEMLENSDIKKAVCESACETPEEFAGFCRAFYEKETNLREKERTDFHESH